MTQRTTKRATLVKREKMILHLHSKGWLSTEIAKHPDINCDQRTVQRTLQNILSSYRENQPLAIQAVDPASFDRPDQVVIIAPDQMGIRKKGILLADNMLDRAIEAMELAKKEKSLEERSTLEAVAVHMSKAAGVLIRAVAPVGSAPSSEHSTKSNRIRVELIKGLNAPIASGDN